jgi:hypothetical protein
MVATDACVAVAFDTKDGCERADMGASMLINIYRSMINQILSDAGHTTAGV